MSDDVLKQEAVSDYKETNDTESTVGRGSHSSTMDVRGTLSSIHSSGFRKFLLKAELLRAIVDSDFEHPTEVQHECLPQAILGMDIVSQAKDGMGKSTVFMLATLQQLEPRDGQVSVLVLTPTKELALQIYNEYERLSKYLTNIKVAVYIGGVSIKRDTQDLMTNCPHIVIGTVGRILHLARINMLNLQHVKHFILDECDKMLGQSDMRGEVQEIFGMTPQEKQVMMFSATLTKEIFVISKEFMEDVYNQECVPYPSLLSIQFIHSRCVIFTEENPVCQPMEVYVDDKSRSTPHSGLTQHHVKLKEDEKNRKLIGLLDALEFKHIVIFAKSVKRCSALSGMLFEQNFPVIATHRAMPKEERLMCNRQFKDLKKCIMVTTNLFGGDRMDIEGINIIVNYDMPENYVTYSRRVDCAGQFGTKGLVVSFVSNENDARVLIDVQDRFGVTLSKLPSNIDVSTYIEEHKVS